MQMNYIKSDINSINIGGILELMEGDMTSYFQVTKFTDDEEF